MRLMAFAKYEQQLKWLALVLGLASTIAIINDWYPWTMFIGLPFCLIWVYCAWLHSKTAEMDQHDFHRALSLRHC